MNSYGTLDLQSNLKIHNYDTNKLTKFWLMILIGIQEFNS